MNLLLNIDMKKLAQPVSYRDKIMLIGSCFTEHIGNALGELKFSVLQNPNGILFGPDAVCKSLLSYIDNKKYTATDLFRLNEVWSSWQHHSRFSNTDPHEALRIINESQERAHEFLKTADWLIITLGSSFSYKLAKLPETAQVSPPAGGGDLEGAAVANCHRAPAQWFKKELLEIPVIIEKLEHCLRELSIFNPGLKIIFTVSPVRHIRDGVVENNRSKARLLESVHQVVSKWEQASYFPAYELVIDVLRDYRFYDIDLVHPNYSATEFVLEKFAETCIGADTQQWMQEVRKIVIARKHKAFQPGTTAHRQFLATHLEKTQALQERLAFLDFKKELAYFSQT